MEYVVKHGGEYSERFKSTIGVLTGDSASPGLWNFYFADLTFPDDPDDIVLAGTPVPFMAHADDGALLSTTSRGAQRRTDVTFTWSTRSFADISITKTFFLPFNTLPYRMPRLYVGDREIHAATDYKFIGLAFCTTERNIFSKNYTIKASKARGLSRSTFAAERHVGMWAPAAGIRLYNARVDPHLTFGADVIPDVDEAGVKLYEDVQSSFARRLLHLTSRSMLAALYTETGLMPIRFRRAGLALGYAKYLLNAHTLEVGNIPHLAYLDTIDLARNGESGWAGDLRIALGSLPCPVEMEWDNLLSEDKIATLITAVRDSCETYLRTEIYKMTKSQFLKGRKEEVAAGRMAEVMLYRREYLRIKNSANRIALTQLMCSDHSLGVELLRRRQGPWKHVYRHWRLCRFCRHAVEDECHAMLICTGEPRLRLLRADFLRDLWVIWPDLRSFANIAAVDFLLLILHCPNKRVRWAVTTRVSRFVRQVFDVYEEYPIWIPPVYLSAFGAGELLYP
ncbi:hypothetical protein C8F01DRAFT_976823 [Mycena amicta]|nr:hypothetical protein C8F01DRAFT_976823 [Mycena amicta]